MEESKRYSETEMLFFNGLIDGKEIFGVPLRPPREDFNAVVRTIHNLMRRSILNDDGSLAEYFPNPIVMLDYYKAATRHVILNNVTIALCDNKEMVAVSATPEGYDIFSGNTWNYLYTFFLATPIFSRRESGEERSQVITDAEYAGFLADPAYTNSIIIRKYEEKKLTHELTLLWNSDVILYIDGKSRIKRAVNGFEVRMLLIGLFEIAEGYSWDDFSD